MQKGKDFIGVGCGAHIINDNNQILLLKRNENCRNKAGYWTIPGGGVEYSEKVEDALKRETKEELGIGIEILRLLSVTDDIIEEEGQHWISPQFLCKITTGEPKNLEPEKHDEMRWFDLDNLPDKITNTTKDGVGHLKNYFTNK
jgi:ADP-ribose pyrophosphatase